MLPFLSSKRNPSENFPVAAVWPIDEDCLIISANADIYGTLKDVAEVSLQRIILA